jgi:DNA replication protein DnaC
MKEPPNVPPPPKSPDVLAQKLLSLKLTHWQEAMAKDIPNLDPAAKTLVLDQIGRWADFELAARHSTTIGSRIKAAKFVKVQTIDGFDFDYNKSTRASKGSYLPLHHATAKGEVLPRAVFVGTAGLGKTHLARALGYAACQAKASVLFTTTAKMVNHLAAAKASHRLEAELSKYRRPRVAVFDELGYVSMDLEASNLFFQVISARHDEGLGTIVTTNIPFGEWNQIFAGNAIAHAIVDRLTDGASIFFLEGISYREARSKKDKKS